MRIAVCLVLAIVCLLPIPSHAAAIHDAAKDGDVAAVAATLEAGADVNEMGGSGQATPLYYAVLGRSMEAANLLIARGAEVNISSKWGGAPLFRASWQNNAEMVKLLLANGADPNAIFKTETALHKAADSGCLECVKLLLGAGADMNVLNTKGQPPIHYAVINGHSAIADLLRSSGYAPPVVAPIAAKLKNGDPVKGEALYAKKCGHCHDDTAKKSSVTGPFMWGIVGRPVASIREFEYSKAFDDREGSWSYESLNAFIAAPPQVRPGMEAMWASDGYADETDRIDLISYLRLLADSPEPLP